MIWVWNLFSKILSPFFAVCNRSKTISITIRFPKKELWFVKKRTHRSFFSCSTTNANLIKFHPRSICSDLSHHSFQTFFHLLKSRDAHRRARGIKQNPSRNWKKNLFLIAKNGVPQKFEVFTSSWKPLTQKI